MKIKIDLYSMDTLETAALALLHASCEDEIAINSQQHTGTIIVTDDPRRAANLLHALAEIIDKAKHAR